MSEVEREDQLKFYRQFNVPTFVDNWTDEEEQEWDALFVQPHVQKGL